jgi:hypothetical protein
MDSRAGNAPGFEKRRNAVSGCKDYKGNDEYKLPGPDGSRMARQPKYRTPCKCEENKAQHLMPQRMDGFNRSRKNVLDELSGLPRQMPLGH